jgi:hypothetical protein
MPPPSMQQPPPHYLFVHVPFLFPPLGIFNSSVKATLTLPNLTLKIPVWYLDPPPTPLTSYEWRPYFYLNHKQPIPIHNSIPHPTTPFMAPPLPHDLSPRYAKVPSQILQAPSQPQSKTKKAQTRSKEKGKATQNPPHPTTSTHTIVESNNPPCVLWDLPIHPIFH